MEGRRKGGVTGRVEEGGWLLCVIGVWGLGIG